MGMWKNKPPFRLCLNKAAGEEIIWHCKHYTGRGVMKYYENGADLAKDMGVSLQTVVDSHQQHHEASQKAAKDQKVVVGQHTHLASLGTLRVVRREAERNFITPPYPETR